MILVCGATGNIGRHLIPALKAHGIAFKALAHTDRSAEALEAQGAACVRGSFSSLDSLRQAIDGVEAIFLLLPASPHQPQQAATALAAIESAGGGRVVYVSAMGASASSACAFARANGRVESLLARSGIPHSIIRPTAFMQNLPMMHGGSAKAASLIAGYEPTVRTAYIDTRDVAECAATLLADPSTDQMVFEITGPDSLSLNDIAARLTAKLGKPIAAQGLSEAEYFKLLTGYGVPNWTAHGVIGLQHLAMRGLGGQVTGTVERMTGRKPRGIDAFLDENLAAFK